MPPSKKSRKQEPAAVIPATNGVRNSKMDANKKVDDEGPREINSPLKNGEPKIKSLEKHSVRPILSRSAKSKIKNYTHENENEKIDMKKRKINKNAKDRKIELTSSSKHLEENVQNEIPTKKSKKDDVNVVEDFEGVPAKRNRKVATATSSKEYIENSDEMIPTENVKKNSMEKVKETLSKIVSEDEQPKKDKQNTIKKPSKKPKKLEEKNETETRSEEPEEIIMTKETESENEKADIKKTVKERNKKISKNNAKGKEIVASNEPIIGMSVEEELNNLPEKIKEVEKAAVNSLVINTQDKNDFDSEKPNNFKITSWNVAGLRAWIKKVGLDYFTKENPDIICFQEIKCTEDQVPNEARLSGYHPYWLGSSTGQAGIALYSKRMPLNVEYGIGDKSFDNESRIMTAEYNKFYLINVYVPNAGRKLITLPKRLAWNKVFENFIENLNKKKPVIICGDMNVSHLEIDLANPKTNKRSAGFTQEERDGMSNMLSLGFVDTFRYFYPTLENAYTYWTYMKNARAKNIGWRLDYFIVSERFLPKVVDNKIRSNILGSDHCPITLLLNL